MATNDLPSGNKTPGNAAMTLEWVKSNWTILSVLVLGGVYMVQTDRDNKNAFANITSTISDMKETAADRSKIADDFYSKQTDLNIPNRLTTVEKQVSDIMAMLQRGQDRQDAANAALRSDVQNVAIEVKVVASKVDDLRDKSPKKASMLLYPQTMDR